MRVLVTGGAGFIGSHVVDRLRAAGVEPVIFDRIQSQHHNGDIRSVVADLLDEDAVREAVAGCDVVVHLAAIADVSDVVADPALADRVNVRGTQIVLEAARRADVRGVVYGSTVWVYGDATVNGHPLDEDSPLAVPPHLYTATKLAGEAYARSYNELYGTENVVLRFGIPYGPRARPAAVVPSFVLRALRGEALTIAGDGRQTRQFVYVEDLADGVVAAVLRATSGRTYNLVGDEETSVRGIADAVREKVAPVPIEHGPERPTDVHLGRISPARAAAELGWTATTPFTLGLERYVEWLTQTNGSPVAATASSTNGSAAAVRRQESGAL